VAKLPARTRRNASIDVRLGFVTSQFNTEITDAMLADARQTANRLGASIVVDVRVPGVFDLPLVLSRVLARKDVDGAVVLGAVITGETKHDELIATECARQVADLAVRVGKPIGFGVTGPGQTEAQARARVDRAGWAVESVCSQFKTLRTLQGRDAGTG
jgi:6,7-dimethyl-8-ribityllumazine synthase